MARRSSQPLPQDPLLAGLIVVWRRWWAVALGAALGAGAGWQATPVSPPRFVARAQVFIKTRPVFGGERQEPVNAVAYADAAESPSLRARVGQEIGWSAGVTLSARVATTQDTNFGKHYSPLLLLEIRAPLLDVAERGLGAWRGLYLELYGDLASRDARETAKRLEQELETLQKALEEAYKAESLAEAAMRPLRLKQASLERALAPFVLRLAEPLPSHPRTQAQARDRLVVQDIQIAPNAAEPTSAEGLALPPDASGAYGTETLAELARLRAALAEGTDSRSSKRLEELAAEVEAKLAALAEPLAQAQGKFRAAQAKRVGVESRIAETSRQAELNRLASLQVELPPEALSAPEGATLRDAADLAWLELGDPAETVPASRSKAGLAAGAILGALLAAIAAALQFLSSRPEAWGQTPLAPEADPDQKNGTKDQPAA